MNRRDLLGIINNIKNSKYLNLLCLSVHIGSQITSHKPYEKMLKELSDTIKASKYKFEYIDLGGGMGIQYDKSEKALNYVKYLSLIRKFLKKYKCKIIFEPGRSIIGNTGYLASRVIYVKNSGKKNFVILDAAMNDFMRPALYGARHKILAAKKNNSKSNKIYEFVGPICETTDKFLTTSKFQVIKEGDVVLICDVGAYGIVLSSNYNLRTIPQEVLIKGSKIKTIKIRQSLKALNS